LALERCLVAVRDISRPSHRLIMGNAARNQIDEKRRPKLIGMSSMG
jgi:hypothetical protein